MKNHFKQFSILLLAAMIFGSVCAQPFQPRQNAPIETVSSRQEIEAYAATNKTFAPAIAYFTATINGSQPAELPQGVTPADIAQAVHLLFPKANMVFDAPINFYGRVVDESNEPIADANIHFELSGTFIRGRNSADVVSDGNGYFSLLGKSGSSLGVSVSKAHYYTPRRNQGVASFQYAVSSGNAFIPDLNKPVLYYLQKKGIGAQSLTSSQYGVYQDFSVEVPRNGTNAEVDLINRKVGSGPLEFSQTKPLRVNWRTTPDWSFSVKIPSGGFIEENEEFPFNPPEIGYEPTIAFNFHHGESNWMAGINKDYFIKFGSPPLYGHLHVETDIRSSNVRLTYTINPDGSPNLEPPNENTPTKAPVPFVATLQPLSPKILFTNASGEVVTWGSMVMPFIERGTRFTAVAAGAQHSLAIKMDGTVVAWGRNISGEANVPAGLSNVIAISAGGHSGSGFSVALRRDGTVIAWGDNSSGQTNVPPGLSEVIAISAGRDHCLVLRKDGTVVAWGSRKERKTEVPTGLSNVVAVAAAGDHSVALKRDGTLAVWGQIQWGRGTGPEELSDVISICCGSDFGLALKKDGTVAQWGERFSKETDLPQNLGTVIAIAAGPWNGMALDRDGTVTEWGHDMFLATHVPPGLNHVVALSGGGNDQGGHTLALKDDGSIVGWGNNNFGQSLPPGGLTDVISISGVESHYLALRSDGSVIGWGGGEQHDHGQALVPPDLRAVKQVSAGWARSLILRTDGSVAEWGDRFFGFSGPAPGLTDIVAVSAGYENNLALKKDGSVIIWADSTAMQGQIFSNAIAIAAAPHHCIALRRDGKVMSWGANGVLAKSAPDDLTNVIAIATWGDAAFDRDVALRRDGTVFAWGSWGVGSPQSPEGLSNIIAIAAGADHSLALRQDGTVIGWGYNRMGQITIPEGLSNVIAIAGGGSSSAAIVLLPQSRPPLVPLLRPQTIKVITMGVAILLLAVGGFWILTRRATNRAS